MICEAKKFVDENNKLRLELDDLTKELARIKKYAAYLEEVLEEIGDVEQMHAEDTVRARGHGLEYPTYLQRGKEGHPSPLVWAQRGIQHDVEPGC